MLCWEMPRPPIQSPEKPVSRDSATYAWPQLKASSRCTWAFEMVMPWDLWTVRAQPSLRGSCKRLPMVVGVVCWNRSRSILTVLPLSNLTVAALSWSSTTKPRLPFTRPWAFWRFRRITWALTFSCSSCGTALPRRSSSRFLSPDLFPEPPRLAWKLSSEAKACARPGSLASSRLFSWSTSRLVQYSRVGTMPVSGCGFTPTRQRPQSSCTICVHWPARTWFRSCTKAGSPDCRTACCRMTVPCCSWQRCQAGVSKQKDQRPPSSRPASTGGSCRKSPQMSSCRPPKPLCLSPRISRPMNSSWSKRSGSSMEISSMTRTRAPVQRATVFSEFLILESK
mmetsp:Transcript_70030/g.216555  ORF Transcript_70030/g.216555 Transcript_70030/m.216555 type:complete len:338 (+) Transcript_70030:251-1264(+)